MNKMGSVGHAPKISVITPSLNQGKYLRQCIESVVSQNYENLEFLIIDGGSTDESLAVIKDYEERITYWVSEPDDGQSDAINKGFKRATGDLVAWLNADDYYLPGALEAIAMAYRRDPSASFYFGDGLRVDEHGKSINNFFPSRPITFNRQALVMGLNYILQPSTFINRRALERVGYVDVSLHYGMDSDLWMRLSKAAEPCTVEAVLAASREYENTKTALGSFERIEELRRISSKHSAVAMTPGAMCYLLDTFYKLAQQRNDVYPAWYLEAITSFWDKTAELLDLSGARKDGFPVRKK